MNADAYKPRPFSPPGALRSATLIVLLALAPLTIMADTPPAPDTRTAKVSLADLDLSTPEGARAARERLHETAQRMGDL